MIISDSERESLIDMVNEYPDLFPSSVYADMERTPNGGILLTIVGSADTDEYDVNILIYDNEYRILSYGLLRRLN